jgi:hypothetical protein
MLTTVHGTAADNVFAIATTPFSSFPSPHLLLRFDGTQWTNTRVSFPNGEVPTGVFAVAPDKVYAATRTDQATTVYVISLANGTWTSKPLISRKVQHFNSGISSTGLWVFSPTNIYVADFGVWQTDGVKVTVLGTLSSSYTVNLWGTGTNTIFEATPTGNSIDVGIWNGDASPSDWSTANTGFNGWLGGITGTAANRVFVTGTNNPKTKSVVISYDGIGTTQQEMPDGVTNLAGIWAASTGEVFAVGGSGAIVKGVPKQ